MVLLRLVPLGLGLLGLVSLRLLGAGAVGAEAVRRGPLVLP